MRLVKNKWLVLMGVLLVILAGIAVNVVSIVAGKLLIGVALFVAALSIRWMSGRQPPT